MGRVKNRGGSFTSLGIANAIYYAVNNGAKIIKLEYILSKNLSHRPEFDLGINQNNKQIVIKRPYITEYKRLKLSLIHI